MQCRTWPMQSGVLYNKDMFEEHGWTIPTTWDEFTALCERIEAEGIQPLYFGFKDSWTCLAPWNAIAADLAPSDVCSEVNKGNTTFIDNYREVAEKEKALLAYAQDRFGSIRIQRCVYSICQEVSLRCL